MKDYRKQLKGALLALPYFDGINRALSAKELRRYVWGGELEVHDLRKAASAWRQPGQSEDLYSLRPIELPKVFANKERLEEYWSWTAKHLRVLSWIPFVKLAMVMNGVAHGVVNPDSDIDLFVVTKRNRLWVARGLMLLTLRILGLRSIPGNKAKRFSPEFFVDEDHQSIDPNWSGSLYLTSFWLADFIAVIYPQNFRRFWLANKWLAEYMPIAYKSPRIYDGAIVKKSGIANILEKLLGGKLGDNIEERFGAYQKRIINQNLKDGGQLGTVVTDSTVKILWPLNIQRASDVDRHVKEFLG